MPDELRLTVMPVCFSLLENDIKISLMRWISVWTTSKKGIEGKGTNGY